MQTCETSVTARPLRRRARRSCASDSATARASWPRPSWPTCGCFGAPRALGVALRVAGSARGGDAGLRLLGESVAALRGSPALLERAHSLAELGAALRRSGGRAAAREPLAEALDLAARCGARPLAARAREELKATGARPRRAWRTGVEALTPSELRVARLAAEGRSNREIAHELYVTLKTIEGHLARAYAKLGIEGRGQLPRGPRWRKDQGAHPVAKRSSPARPCGLHHPPTKEAPMARTAREAFERGTDTFNAHDLDGFAEVLADDVVFNAPGGMRGEGKAACVEFFGGWFVAFPDAHVEVTDLHINGDVAVEEGTFTGTQDGDPPQPGRRYAADRARRQPGLHPGAPLPRWRPCLLQPGVRPALDARAARARPRDGARGLRVRSSSRRQREP